eukprot:TRINITY_DN2221_c0_g1_i1.p1 TRINITY_DN2221_c0_g1~~TRINITY_DN2221_c0_g1_i1.p1  ORF type:complete len:145 (+),score=30.25 TRINITY_DN2221_c0_g1_i1:57-437(+)
MALLLTLASATQYCTNTGQRGLPDCLPGCPTEGCTAACNQQQGLTQICKMKNLEVDYCCCANGAEVHLCSKSTATTTTTTTATGNQDPEGISAGGVVGIIIALLVVIGVAAGGVYYVMKRRGYGTI